MPMLARLLPMNAKQIGWALHWVVRMAAFGLLMPYAVFKLGLMQMGRPDFPELLITLGEKSPMAVSYTHLTLPTIYSV